MCFKKLFEKTYLVIATNKYSCLKRESLYHVKGISKKAVIKLMNNSGYDVSSIKRVK